MQIDIYHPEREERIADLKWWFSDTSSRYAGWLYNDNSKIIGDFSAPTLQAIEKWWEKLEKQKVDKQVNLIRTIVIDLTDQLLTKSAGVVSTTDFLCTEACDAIRNVFLDRYKVNIIRGDKVTVFVVE